MAQTETTASTAMGVCGNSRSGAELVSPIARKPSLRSGLAAIAKPCGPCGTLVPVTLTCQTPAWGFSTTTCSMLLRWSSCVRTAPLLGDAGLSVQG